MNMLENIEQQLTDNQSRVAGLLQQLERHGDISKSLESAGHGIKETGERVADLSESTRGLVEATANVITSLRETVELLRRADLERVSDSLEGVKSKLDETHLEGLRANQETHEQIMAKHVDLTELLRLMEGLSCTHMEKTGRVQRISIASLCLVALLLGLEVLQLLL